MNITANQALDKGLWDKLCQLKGWSVWRLNEGTLHGDEPIELTYKEAFALGMTAKPTWEEIFQVIDFPEDYQYREMVERTVTILKDYAKNSRKYKQEAEASDRSVEETVANYIVSQICDGLEKVEIVRRLEEKLKV